MSNLLYILGFVTIVAGLTYGAFLMGISPEWITVGVIIMAGIGLVNLAKRSRGVSR
jgi:hypothetical protein